MVVPHCPTLSAGHTTGGSGRKALVHPALHTGGRSASVIFSSEALVSLFKVRVWLTKPFTSSSFHLLCKFFCFVLFWCHWLLNYFLQLLKLDVSHHFQLFFLHLKREWNNRWPTCQLLCMWHPYMNYFLSFYFIFWITIKLLRLS